MKTKPNILLIYTGGTIGMVKDYNTRALRPFNFEELLENIPELKQLDCTLTSISFENPVDSSNMNPDRWGTIATIIEENYEACDGFVVLHGSDTMSYSASALSFMLENLAKPVIFTGSQLPVGDLRTDAKENVITSIQIAALQQNGKPVIQEVGLYFEYKLYRANRTTKISAEHFRAFASPNYPTLIESGVHLKVHVSNLWKPSPNSSLQVHTNMHDRVVILKIFPGLDKEVLKSVLHISGVKVVILETYGAGNAPTASWFLEELEKAIKKGLHIINVTQCAGGSVTMGYYETGEKLKELQVINGKDITTEAAVAKALYLLGSKIPDQFFKSSFETSLRGEIL